MNRDKQLAIALQTNRLMQLNLQSMTLSDEVAMEVADLYPEWAANKNYAKDDIVKYGLNEDNETQLYKITVAHVSQAQYLPNSDIAHYTKIGFTEDGTAIWTQPLGAHDAYKKGDVVSHKDKTWVSDVDNNVWEPGVYGWTEKN